MRIYLLFFVIFIGGCTPENKLTLPVGEPVQGIVFVSERDGNPNLYVIQPDGTGLRQLTGDPAVDSDPAWSPDGTMIAFRSRLGGSSDIYVMAADGSTAPVNLVNDDADSFLDEFKPAWHPSGQKLALYTDRFQPPLGSCAGLRGVHHLAFIDLSVDRPVIQHFDELAGEQETMAWSPDGNVLAFGSLCTGAATQLYFWDSVSGEITAITDGNFFATHPAFSPDGRRLAYSAADKENTDIYVLDLETGETQNLTPHPARDTHPNWSPDGKRIAFTSNRDGEDEIFILWIETGAVVNLTQSPGKDYLPDWSPVR